MWNRSVVPVILATLAAVVMTAEAGDVLANELPTGNGVRTGAPAA